MHSEYRLKNKRDFEIVYRFGRSVANQQFVLYYLKQKQTRFFRVGISASKKIGTAVIRNRMRRLIKEIMRLHKDKINQGHDLVIIVRKPAITLTYLDLEKSLFHVLRKSGLVSTFRKPQ